MAAKSISPLKLRLPKLPRLPDLPDLPRLCLAITERAPLPMATLEGATRIIRYGNSAFCRLVNRPLKKFVGRSIDDLLPARDKCVTLINRVYRTKRPESYTEQEPSKPHPIFWSYTIWPVEADHGLVNLMIQVTETAAVHDSTIAMNEALILGSVRQHQLTEDAERLSERLQAELSWRQRAEAGLRESEIRYRRLFEAAHDGVLLLDPATRKITDANPFMTKLLGYSHAQLVGKELFEIGLLRDEGASQIMFRKLKRKHEVRYEDLPLENKLGRHQEVEVVANLYRENNHAVIQCNIRDITQRKLAEGALRRNEALFSALIEQAPMGVYVVDARFRLARINPKALPLFRQVRPLLGRDFVEIINILWSPRVATQVVALYRHTLRTGEPYQSPEFAERRRDTGAEEVYEWQIQRVTLPGGEHGVVCFFNDITERKRAEQAQQRLAVLAAANRKANEEITRRRVVEASLRKSEKIQRGLLLQSQELHAQLRHLTRDLITAQEEERKKISRELHDDVMQTLVGINVALSALTKRPDLDVVSLRRNIARTHRLVRSSLNAVHCFARDLRPAVLDDFGLVPALQAYGLDLAARNKFRIRFRATGDVESLDGTQRTVLFRVAQEALLNVARHARARHVLVRLTRVPGAVRLGVQDDGKSFQVKATLAPGKNKRLGLLGMRERVAMVGGMLTIESFPRRGTLVRAEIPVTPRGAA